jgi:hypothetical protein
MKKPGRESGTMPRFQARSLAVGRVVTRAVVGVMAGAANHGLASLSGSGKLIARADSRDARARYRGGFSWTARGFSY